ncbi:MAG: hypothetical protein ACRDO7_02470, partial [Nocardioidaceae bacterium]
MSRRPSRTQALTAACVGAALLAACSNASDSLDRDPDLGDSASPPTVAAPDDLSAAESDPVDDPYYPDNGEPYFDALHYDLALDWDPSTSELTGTTRLTFRITENR